MKRFAIRKLSIAIIFSLVAIRSLADEGMWLPMLLGEQVYADMVKKGLKLTKEQLYSINKASLKDAVIIFSGFCTGEIVSSQGLIFTNHHCGYSAIAAASSIEHNYLKDGFWSKSKEEEIPSQGLYAEFLVKIEDVTSQVQDAVGGLNGEARGIKLRETIATLNKQYSDPENHLVARVSSLFNGNQFLVFVYQHYSDIRLVAAPSESIGKFGGDTDNWEWPRHTGDFSVFRVYMSKDGKPADYSPANIPLKPKYFLPVSIKTKKEGDYAMIYGYPGSTNRYESSFGVRQKIDIDNPTIVALRDMRLKFMFEEMKKDPAVKLQLADSYAGIANYWKFYDGERKQLIKYNIYEQRKSMEDKFMKWAGGKPEYQDIFNDWAKAYDQWRPYSKHRYYINEGIMGSPLLAFAASLQQVENALVKKGSSGADVKKAVEAADKARIDFLKSENKPSDMNIVASMLRLFYHDIDKSQQPIGFYENVKANYGSLDMPATYSRYTEDIFSKTMIFDNARWKAFTEIPDAVTLQNDPAYATANAFLRNWQGKFLPRFQQFVTVNNDMARLYLKGIREMDTVKAKKMYPDATFTMRVSFGNVKSYSPRDAVKYDYVTTMSGVLQKYVPGDYEFDLPAKLLELARKKDFGQYMDPVKKDLVVGFITTNDITGGNSGSPVLDGSGNLVGLAFDGNYEALSHKIAFDKDLNRTICVDIRYVLWCIDKIGNAGNIIRELKLVK